MKKNGKQLKPHNQRVYNYITALYKSFYSRLLYIDVAKRWKGFGALYLLILLMIVSLPFSVRLLISFNEVMQNQVMSPLSKIPDFYIQNGLVKFDKPMPFKVTNDKNHVVVIVDTTGKVNQFSPEYPYLTVLITADKLSFRMPNPPLFLMPEEDVPNTGEIIDQKFDKNSNLVFNGATLFSSKSIKSLQYGFLMMVYPMVVSVLFSIFVVMLGVLGLLGQSFSQIFFNFKIDFKTSIRILTVASTPMLVLLLTLLSLNRVFMGLGFILIGLLTAYYSFAILSVKSDSQRIAIQ